MIPRAVVQAWASEKPWSTLVQVEQDLVLARLIVEISEHPVLGEELVFRGGTCLHQLVMDRPRRYSEDLDYVRSTHSGIGSILDSVRDVAAHVGLDVAGTKIGEHPKVFLRAASETEPTASLKIKVEINTHETSPALPILARPFEVGTEWFSGHAEVRTFASPELIATKIRALYQRKKGRDLFDMWLALTELGIAGDDIVGAFSPYRPAGIAAALSEANLRAKLSDDAFRNDLNALVAEWPEGYDIDQAAELVIGEVLRKI
ncbi:nucleotidyl transferase AbiEii/AbiGii toxin family protein [Nocardioides dilutus]